MVAKRLQLFQAKIIVKFLQSHTKYLMGNKICIQTSRQEKITKSYKYLLPIC